MPPVSYKTCNLNLLRASYSLLHARRHKHKYYMFRHPYHMLHQRSRFDSPPHRTIVRSATVSGRAALAMELVAAHTEEAAKARQESALNAAKFRRASRDAGQASAAPTTGALGKPQRAPGGRPPTVSGNRCVAWWPATQEAKHTTLLSVREMRRLLAPNKVVHKKDTAWKSCGPPPPPEVRRKEACSLFPLLPRNSPGPGSFTKTKTPFCCLV